MSIRYLSISQLSELTGMDRRTVKDKLAAVKPHEATLKKITYDTFEALPVLYGIEELEVQKQMESLRLEKGRADKIELEVAKTRGEQVPIEDVAQVVEKEYTRVRAQLLSIPTRMAKDLSTQDDPSIIKIMLEDIINEALSELSADEKLINKEIPDSVPEDGDSSNTPAG